MASPEDRLTFTFSARLWSPIDAIIDNAVSMAHVDADAGIVEPGQRVREAGWAAMRSAPETNDLGWPSEGYQMSITAARSDWVVVLTQLEQSEAYADEGEGWFYRAARQTIGPALEV